ncbi:MAG: CopG family transcriptional regulator [Chloroflexota bacterium]|nr:MAG: antitoxin [Chloroflexota bacterium]
MQKTTVYLSDELKRLLERAAVETQRSEAEVIREGIRMAAESSLPPAPHSGIFDSGDPCMSERVDELLEGLGRQ